MNKLLLVLLGLSLAGSANAQTVVTPETPTASIAVDPSLKFSLVENTFPISAAAPQAENIKLDYYDENGTPFNWQATWQPDQNQQFAILGYGQRFTLPSNGGFLDSVRIRFNIAQSLPQGSPDGEIAVFIVTDSLFEFQTGPYFHLPLLQNVIGSATVKVAQLEGIQNFWLTLTTGHMAIPKEFFIYVRPTFTTQGAPTSGFFLASEIKSTVSRSTEHSRSVFHYITPQGESVSILDSFFQVNTQPVDVNFMMEAFVDVETGSVASQATSAAAMFPNPVGTGSTLNIEHNEQINSVRIVNMLGNEMQSWTGKSASVKLSTSELSTGVYNVIVNTENGVTTEKLIVN